MYIPKNITCHGVYMNYTDQCSSLVPFILLYKDTNILPVDFCTSVIA